MAQVVEHPPHKNKVPSSNPSTLKKEQKNHEIEPDATTSSKDSSPPLHVVLPCSFCLMNYFGKCCCILVFGRAGIQKVGNL
jgi:hypothetical protein